MSVKNPEKRRVLAASELSGIHGNGFESTFVVSVRDVRRTKGGVTDLEVRRTAKGRTDILVRQEPCKTPCFAASELSGIHGNGFESTFVVCVKDVRRTKGG